jgi:hypothetical protein
MKVASFVATFCFLLLGVTADTKDAEEYQFIKRPESWGYEIDINNFDAVVDDSASMWALAFSDSTAACEKCGAIDANLVGLCENFFGLDESRKIKVGRVETSTADGKALMERLGIGNHGAIPSVHLFTTQHNTTSELVVGSDLESSAEAQKHFKDFVALQPVDEYLNVLKHPTAIPLEVGPNQNTPPGELVPISWDSRIFKMDGFLSEEECDMIVAGALHTVPSDHLSTQDRISLDILGAGPDSDRFVRMSPKQQQLVKSIERRVATMTMIAPHQAEAWLFVRRGPCIAANNCTEDEDHKIRNVHHDQNGAENRVATVIVFLSNVDEGGHTIFPSARVDPNDAECVALNASIAAAHAEGKRFLSRPQNDFEKASDPTRTRVGPQSK